MAPAAVASSASMPPVGNPIARPASFGFAPEEAFAGDEVGVVPEVGEPAPATAWELDGDSSVAAGLVFALDFLVEVALTAVAVALALAGSEM